MLSSIDGPFVSGCATRSRSDSQLTTRRTRPPTTRKHTHSRLGPQSPASPTPIPRQPAVTPCPRRSRIVLRPRPWPGVQRRKRSSQDLALHPHTLPVRGTLARIESGDRLPSPPFPGSRTRPQQEEQPLAGRGGGRRWQLVGQYCNKQSDRCQTSRTFWSTYSPPTSAALI